MKKLRTLPLLTTLLWVVACGGGGGGSEGGGISTEPMAGLCGVMKGEYWLSMLQL